MNTPAHLVIGLAAFARADRPRVTAAALAGALLPDLSLYLMVFAAFALGHSAQEIFGTLYFSDPWQRVFAIDNSFVLWGLGLAAALWCRSTVAVAFAGAGLLHLAFDFPLHNDDARMMFWPLTEWKFLSPISYWDRGRGGDMVEMVELALVAALTVLLLRRFRGLLARAGLLALAALELAPPLIFRILL